MSITLSKDQEQALSKLEQSVKAKAKVSLLVGLAGTGKTTIMKELANRYIGKRDVVLVAPTGKAASVLQAKTKIMCRTIHSALYSDREEHGDDLLFKQPGPPCAPGGLVFCDEASMVGQGIYNDLVSNLPKGAQLIGLGDQGQLQPVNDQWGFDFNSPTAELTTIHRQAGDNPIIQLAWALRNNSQFSAWKDGVCQQGLSRPVPWVVKLLKAKEDVTLLAFSNKSRKSLNNKIRHALGHHKLLQPGDKVLCLHNNFDMDMMNGEVLTVLEISPCTKQPKASWGGFRPPEMVNLVLLNWQGETTHVRTNLAYLGARVSEYLRWKQDVSRGKQGAFKDVVHLDHGFALTVHKSQGSEWKHVGFVADAGYRYLFKQDFPGALRLAYTAVTRAREHLSVFGRL